MLFLDNFNITYTLDKVLQDKGKTKYWLSKQTGIDNNTLSKLCKNEAKQTRVETLVKICVALECELIDVMTFNIKK